ncbi:Enterocin A Immunity [Kandleria vitulina]|uniref:Enterocin A Immunity n=1 Tax=Kandleria vitulina TaxID=1630 RepID=A0A1H2QBI3_9FIRM|nr:bacteriocin immunity protein [Kandleria vitulina]SDW04482.1 Enterocin A Immunity [Kandleria vitulina]
MRRKEKILTFLADILNDHEISSTEREIFEDCFTKINYNEDINRCIFKLKQELSLLATKQQLSSKGVSYFNELSRIEPSTSVSSMWNFLVRRKK